MKINLARLGFILTILWTGWSGPASAVERLESCYDKLGLHKPEHNLDRVLYLIIDQTMPLSAEMLKNINSLVADWPRPGERVKIARFSANTRGQYNELIFDAILDGTPGEEYLYHLRDADHANLLGCMKQRNQEIQQAFSGALNKGMALIDTSLPKTEIFYALKQLSGAILDDGIADKTVLIITDGMENGEFASFYKRRAGIGKVSREKMLEILKKNNLHADWRGAKIYMFGLGNMRDSKLHITPTQLENLRKAWEAYFHACNGNVRQLGTPAVLLSNLREVTAAAAP